MSETRSGDVDYESIALRSDDAVVSRDDLLHCLQVAHWRAGLLRPDAYSRICEALGIEQCPKPEPRP